MDIESNSESKDSMDSVAQALMNIFSNDAEASEDHSLSMFLVKIYKNNLSAKQKRMNSIRLTRFNAFLYRLHSNYPTSPVANTLIHHTLLAVLTNDRNFQEEEDEEIVTSIGRWVAQILLDTIDRGFHQSAFLFLKYLVQGEKPVLQGVSAFEQTIRGEPYFGEVELSSEDQRVALRQVGSYSLTTTFSLPQFILQLLNVTHIYSALFSQASNKLEVVRLFNHHIAKTSPENPTDLFMQVFLTRPPSCSAEIEAVLETLQENYFGHQATIKAVELLIRQQEKIGIYFGVRLRDSEVEKLFLQLLSEHWRKRSIDQLIEEFLNAGEIANISILYLLVSNDAPVPRKYLLLPFQQAPFLYQHSLIFSLALAHHNDKKLPTELIDLYLKHEQELTRQRKSMIFKAIHYSLASLDKKALYCNIIGQAVVSNFGKQGSLSELPLGEVKADKASADDKKRLLKVLEGHSDDSDSAMKIKAELLGVCNLTSAPTKRIKELTLIMQKPFVDVLGHLTEDCIKKDPQLVAALLMAVNNKLYLTFVPEPKTNIIEILISIYLDLHQTFGKTIGRLEGLERASSRSLYYAALFRLGLHWKRRIGTIAGEVGELLSGEVNYRRVNGMDFADYLIREEQRRGVAGELWTGKKIVVQLRQLLENIVNFNVAGSENRRQLKGMFDSEWLYPLAFETIRNYFQAEIDDPPALRQLLALLQPSYEFFERVETICNQQFDDYIDILHYVAEFLHQIYPEMLGFLAQLVQSQPARKDKEKQHRKSSKKKTRGAEKAEKAERFERAEKERLEKQRIMSTEIYINREYIFDNAALFDTIIKRKELRALFGEASLLNTFGPLITILTKLNDDFNRLQRIVNEWLPTVKAFQCQPECFSEWTQKVISFCELWQFFLKKKYKVALPQLQRHFLIFTEFLNVLYESKRQLPDLEEKLLLTLLLIYQAACEVDGQQEETEGSDVPAEALKNFFLGYRLATPSQQHYYLCLTCSLPICQVCLPFLHKHHDVNYLGKDGFCVHDSAKRKEEDNKPVDRQRDRQRQRDTQRLSAIGASAATNIFMQQPSYSYGQQPPAPGIGLPGYQPALMRNQRREEDWLMNTFEFPDEDVDFGGQHQRMNTSIVGFKEIMELRLREQREKERDREREKQMLFSRERERIEKEREEILQLLEKEKRKDPNIANEQQMEVRSSSTKSITNLHYAHNNPQFFTPEFAPPPEAHRKHPLPIDTRPLRALLLRELQAGEGDEERIEQGRVGVSSLTERYNFFNKSNYFKCANRPDYAMLRGLGQPAVRRSLLTNNGRFLAYPTPNNGVILLVLSNITTKMGKRIQNRAMGDFQQERGFLAGNINNSNFSFEPLQIQFNRNSPNLLAIIGLNQLGFALLSNEGKLQKYADSDFKSPEPISKFMWMTRHRNIFAVATGSSIRLGHVNDEGRVKTTNRFRIHIDKTIRDFDINVEGNALFVYIIDCDGGLYRAQFDYRGAKTLNISQKRLSYSQQMEQLQTLVFADRKLLLTSATGKCYLLQVEVRGAAPSFLHAYDLEAAFRTAEPTRTLKFPAVFSQLQVVQSSEHLFSVGCIIRRMSGDSKKRGGLLAVIRVNSKQSLQVVVLSEEETVQSFQVAQLTENTFLITAVDENGSVFCFHYHIPAEMFNQREDTKIPIDDTSIAVCNTLVRANSLLSLSRYCDPKRFDNFKETKDITGHYRLTLDNTHSIKATTTDPFKFFWTGLLFTAEPKNLQVAGELKFDLLGRHYNFHVEKSRQVQVPLSIKETIEIFTCDGEFSIFLQADNVEVRNCRIFGMDFASESLYKRAFVHLHKLVITHLAFSQNNVEQYLENVDRTSLLGLEVSRFTDLKTAHKYSTRQLSLLLKLELLRQSVEEGLAQEGALEDTLQLVRTHLMPLCERRHYLEKSCWKLVRRLCQFALPVSRRVTGHPLEYRTVLDFYYFEGCYAQWVRSQQLGHFEQLVNLLYALIFKRIGNLYIIFKAYPDLIYSLTTFYKTLLQSLKLSRNEARDQTQLQKLVNICPNFVALVCEYYQILRNSAESGMVDEHEEKSPENIILSLLQEVFCATRKELYREVFISPESYLERLYLSPRQPHPLDTAIDIFHIHQQSVPAPRQSAPLPEDAKSEEEEMELEEESEKESVLEEEAREMEGDEQSNSMEEEKPQIEKVGRIHSLLKDYLLPEGARPSFIYYQFSFQMATALFNLDNKITSQNAVFYIGFLFNLLRILELNVDPERDADYLRDFFCAIHNKIYSEKHSILYMVLNYFFEPTYSEGSPRQIAPSPSKLAREFVKYLQTEGLSPANLLLGFKIDKTYPTVTITEAMKFTSFSVDNHLYQLKFIGNLYFNTRPTSQPLSPSQKEAFKYRILAGVVRYGVRVLRNIMLFEGWSADLEEARVEVGFQTLAMNPEKGVDILVGCSQAHPEVFIGKLNRDHKKIETLELLLEEHKGDSTKIIEMLNTYYSS